MMAKKDVRVRYAPSPTGFLHIGNAQSALFNYLFAKHFGGTMVLRIEDTDLKRNVASGEKSQMDNLRWLGIDWDEGPDKPNPKYAPYHQTERRDLYDKYITELMDKGLAYKDFATEDELKEMRDKQRANKEAPHYDGRWYGASEADIKAAEDKGLPYTIRLHLPKDHTYEWDDIVRGKVEFNSDNLGGDFIIQKSDGLPTYNFAVVVDDHLMDITDVLRGDDHIANTPKQMAVYDALGWKHPNFGHISLIYNPKTGKKLSKRDKDTLQFISEYKREGYLREAIFNFIAFLGWSPVGEKEIFTKDELIKAYDPKRMSKSPAFFDQHKLDWINSQYIKSMSSSEIADRVVELVEEGQTPIAKKIQEDDIPNLHDYAEHVIDIYKHSVFKLTEIMEYVDFYYNILGQDIDYSKLNDFSHEDLEKLFNALEDKIHEASENGQNKGLDYGPIVNEVGKETGMKGKKLYFPLNVIFTGDTSAPQVAQIMGLFSPSVISALINKALRGIE
ncbi:glutamyl-tRNA synthetase [Fructilactobacillus fructivorans]|uniref:Glutamate--tRNA ligase n=2 Tax=Fructilactobacillus fructivorans TaxID=1614 RepID=A0A0C1LX08_9LACO|nr:Glutamyl-tRNA synthetase Glutamyl-tRNA(Gln) synthetase [Fructilactobacillus fructivorans]KRK57480.1 glutamyl-tRNA synthetase [Fructilactobacillus fructivorans]KRN12370.1 glutamyl-tRNA synthetase [Fructilactobacillus fructivorans]